ncbi:hypothetical protein [Motiliproteus sp. SC1-56]|uniref:hypothetical protein n=1 Tax=Motiliproteus sp. SC1-56 TaxID=2799565 RepID=UPI001A904344|nr:hypothetical protein [Motiliproteus sp. SC1-56]
MNLYQPAMLGAALVLGLATMPLNAAPLQCGEDEHLTRAKGKILTNAVDPGTTLGTVHLILEKRRLKCGILGQGGAANGTANFIHTLVCDDAFESPLTGDVIHSQISLATSGVTNFQTCPPGFPPSSATGTFTETSTPIPGTGRGIFEGLATGNLEIEGTLNCLFSLDMEFEGAFCLKSEY